MVPTISSVKLLGSSVNDPVQQYINMPAQQLPKLSSNFLEPVIEFSLSKQDAFFNGSGNLEVCNGPSQVRPLVLTLTNS